MGAIVTTLKPWYNCCHYVKNFRNILVPIHAHFLCRRRHIMGQDPAIILSKQDIERLINAHDGDMALLYLHSRLHGADAEMAARDLCMTSRAVSEAEEKLLRLGISLDGNSSREITTSSGKKTEKLLPAEERPDYSSDDIANCAEEDDAFQSVINEAQRIMGKNLSSNDLKILFGFYDYLGLPAEVIMVLINYCVQRTEAKSNEGRRPTFRTIEKEAYYWANNDIVTLDAAEAYIVRQKERSSMRMQAAKELDIEGRKLTESEIKWLDKWLDMAFDLDVLREAFDRTMTNTGKMAWKYMDAILTNWHDKGIHTKADIAAKEPATPKRTSRKASSADVSATAMNENVDKLLKMVRKKGENKS